jgi:hypothetical protein
MWRRPLGALLAGVGALAIACGSAPPPAFHPGGANPAMAGPPSARLPQASPSLVTWPPFGRDVRIIMPAWLPAEASEVPAVITAKNFLLAFLYAEYRGDRDSRWTAYVAASVAGALRSELAKPDVTTESFTGTIRFSRMSASADPVLPGAVDVSECFSNAQSANVGLHSGQAVPGTVPAGQQSYRNTDALAADPSGRWQVVTVYPVIYYPQARECKP